MPRNISCVLDISVTATSPFSPRRQGEKCLAQETLKLEVSVSDETSTQTKVKCPVENPTIKLPVLTKPRRMNIEENQNLQVLLHAKQCFDFSLQQLRSKLNTSRKTASPGSRDLDIPKDGREITQKDVPFVYDQSHEENIEGAKDNDREKDNVLPHFTSILEGQRLNIQEKEGLNPMRDRQVRCRPTERRNKLSYQPDSTSEDTDIENVLTKSTETQRKNCYAISSKPCKQVSRAVFHLPKADKYDLTPRNIINRKVCSEFKVESALFKSNHKDNWNPRRDSYNIRNSVFKTIIQQPAVFLRQPSPVAGVKMTLKEQEDSLAAAIKVVEDTNVRPPASVDTEMTRQIKKFVVRLPPIC